MCSYQSLEREIKFEILFAFTDLTRLSSVKFETRAYPSGLLLLHILVDEEEDKKPKLCNAFYRYLSATHKHVQF